MISIIVAVSKNNVIGKDNKLPWYYPEDLKYFKETTIDKKVLMGFKTFDSIIKHNGKPLPNRVNFVATRKKDFTYPGIETVNDLISFLKANQDEEIFVIGGYEIYKQALPYAEKLYITKINKDFEGDTYFPEVDYKQFSLISKKDRGELSFCIYQR